MASHHQRALAPADQLEPQVVDMANRLQLHLEGGGQVDPVSAVAPAIYSAAISLRRIADALTGQGPSILTAPINSYGEGIGDAIQGQMIRGQRGIDQYEGREG